jgi:post-segregation antitoxin (ccd killing protein)
MEQHFQSAEVRCDTHQLRERQLEMSATAEALISKATYSASGMALWLVRAMPE